MGYRRLLAAAALLETVAVDAGRHERVPVVGGGDQQMNTTDTPMEPSAQDVATGPEFNGTEAWAICCSGGGIRSASYCLGALQGLEEAGFLGKARLILGRVRRQLYRGIPGARGARSRADGGRPTRDCPRTRLAARKSSTCATIRDTSRPTPRRCWPGCFRCCSAWRSRWCSSSPRSSRWRMPGAGCCAPPGCADLHRARRSGDAAVDGRISPRTSWWICAGR